MLRNVVSFVGFQAGWFACILGAAAERPSTGLWVVAAVLSIHLWSSKSRMRELLLIGGLTVLGGIADSAQIWIEVLEFPIRNGILPESLAPAWIWAMWANFSATLFACLSWLTPRPLVASLLGAIGAPTTYLAGAKLGALQIEASPLPMIALAVEWAVLLPLMGLIAARGSAPSLPSAVKG